MRFKWWYPVNHNYLIAENAELVWCKSNILTNYNWSFLFWSSFMSGPINQHQPIYVSFRLLLTNHIEAFDICLEEEHSTTEGRKQSTSQTYFNNPGYTLVILNESINKANNYWLSGMMESERQVTDGNVSFNKTTVLHVESFATREANVRLSRLPHPPKEKWTQFCLKIIR